MTAEALPAELRRAIVQIARTPRLLVACDYDGTLAPITENPDEARARSESVGALRSLAGLHETTTAVISGRALRDLATLSRLPAEVHLVGSHGSEFDIGFVHEIDAEAKDLHRRVEEELDRLIDGVRGASLEVKPASIAVHVRRAERAEAKRIIESVHSGPSRWEGVSTTDGKEVVELSVIQTDKGNALDTLRHQAGATAAVFVGDDVTDEKAFVRLTGPDLGIKVGDGDSAAQYRVGDTEEVATVLAFMLEERRNWLYGEQSPPIERISMLASERAVALLTPDAKLTWLCHPGPDAAAVFADLLGSESAGHFSIKPDRNGLPLGQRYLPNTMTVETRWSRLLVTDYLEPECATHRTDLVRVISGEATASIVFAPRPEFGGVPVSLIQEQDGLRVLGTSEPFVLRAPGVQWEITNDGMHDTAKALVQPTATQPVVLELRCGTTDLGPHQLSEIDRRGRAGEYWSEWATTLKLPNVEPELVARSALTLRGLANSDTGGVMAAATTSLPEEIGGVRNWDYRYCWIRDGAMTVRELVSLGSLDEAEGFLRWLHGVLATLAGPERLHPLYTLAGTQLGAEAVIDSLPGYKGSRPVRVGNLANHQVQLDVFGPVVELVMTLAEARGNLRDQDWQLVRAMAEAVKRRWDEPDHGIWEERHVPRHRVYSRVMCWVTLDRAIKLGEIYGRPVPEGWAQLRDTIAHDVLEHGWNDEVRAYTTAYDGVDLDAASLFVGLSGLLDPADERFQSTVTAIEAELRSGSTVYRYRRDDGLPGDEGGFHLCAAWMIEAYLLTGRRTEAQELFQQLVDAAGPTGLLPEQYDPVAERSLGNHPQAYSHLGLIRCARLLAE
ncbi:trehalose-phosphatase [Prauserella marina]|uniref:Trehalose-phosphatase n=1 Tax=Prauserella marina TaxID=530584 RepID=A0A222W0M3_9PSEU|nr:trehalose-phosphatase [Prauserella marina]ASR39756.1 trehalose-phosphatase [Prauserella marina]PWV78467.1 trehalose-phosphatase [Prauserella marina]SDC86651.1 trehalose-phosphatase [Prauserella marina]